MSPLQHSTLITGQFRRMPDTWDSAAGQTHFVGDGCTPPHQLTAEPRRCRCGAPFGAPESDHAPGCAWQYLEPLGPTAAQLEAFHAEGRRRLAEQQHLGTVSE